MRRLRAALRALPYTDAHCLAHEAERPDIEAIVERAEAYIDAYERAAALRPMDRRPERAASILRHMVEDLLGPWGVQL